MVRKRLLSVAVAAGLAAGGFLPIAGFTDSAEAAGYHALRPGDRGLQVIWVQKQVGARQTGFYGNETRAGVIRFQRWFHQPATGTVTLPTALKLIQVEKIKRGRRPAPRPAPRAAPRPAPRASALGLRAIQVASTQRGKPYIWGANGPYAFDCSGLTRFVYSKLGKRLPRTTYQQYAVTKIPRNQLRPGDLIFTHDLGHVGIYAGFGQMWNAPHAGARVRLQAVYDRNYLVGRVR